MLNKQISEYESKSQQIGKAYDEFSLKCEHVLEKQDFDLISDMLYRALFFLKVQLDESVTARKEIMDKYDIMYSKDDDAQ